jgi:hypothetical protein
MPIALITLAEATKIVRDAGMRDFIPLTLGPCMMGGEAIEIGLIDPPVRTGGVPNFDKPDPERVGVRRSFSILTAIRDGDPLPPVLLFRRQGDTRYELRDGFHRLHLIAALGYEFIYAEITDWKPGEY